MARFQLLQSLPEELLQEVIEQLDKGSLFALNLASRQCRQFATPRIWREVCLQDCQTIHGGVNDRHDDTPLLRKLLVLINDPWIASCVTTLTHRCHLPPPAIFHELPRTPFSGQTLSSDSRTAKLIHYAVKNMKNVQTLRIIFGHPNINDALLRNFFDAEREPSVRRLWLENCRISAGCNLTQLTHLDQLPMELNFAGLESVRFRRLPIRPAMPLEKRMPFPQYVHARGGNLYDMQNGSGGSYPTTINNVGHELEMNRRACVGFDIFDSDDGDTIDELFYYAQKCDDIVATKITKDVHALGLKMPPSITLDSPSDSIVMHRGQWLDPDTDMLSKEPVQLRMFQREQKPSAEVMRDLLHSCRFTLTNLCLDWVFTRPYYDNEVAWSRTFLDLFELRFPNLKAFQFRNAVVPDTALPVDIYLLGYSKVYATSQIVAADEEDPLGVSTYLDLSSLEFMEAHPNLQCLAWPMEAFFNGKALPPDVATRVGDVIDNLGRTLVDLRVDAMYSGLGEPQSDNFNSDRRRRFISNFAPRMTKLTSIKIEGGVPRDERREIIRALHRCPLEKIVMIGVCCPIGNSWGDGGRDLNETLENDERAFLQAEHKDAIHSLAYRDLQPPSADLQFRPNYGWPPSPPMIHTVASFHASTIRQLKFCGYKGAPVLFTPTPITHPMLASLKHFHNLESLILSMWLNTSFEESRHDADIIRYWLDARSPTSTSLVRITDEEPEGWARELRTKYAPDALAWYITGYVGQFLSETAKARKGGCHVRASMCVGEWGGIFDVDLWIGKGSLGSDVCLGYKGPREELEPGRRREKLENRRWF